MEYRTLEIILQYAKDLSKVNLITKMDVYAVVSISGGDNIWNQKMKTPVDRGGDANPTWNFPMKFTVDEAAFQHNRLALDFQIISERALGDKDIGVVHVAVKELFDSPAMGGVSGKRFISYQVKKPSGKPKGQLTLSYQFGEKISGDAASPPFIATVPSAPPLEYDYSDTVGPRYGHTSDPVAVLYSGGGHSPPASGYPLKNDTPVAAGYPPPLASGYAYLSPPPSPRYCYLPQPGYGCPPPPMQPAPKKKKKFGLGFLGGAIDGLSTRL